MGERHRSPYRASRDGLPIEEAPFWALSVATALIALAIFPALVGLLDAADLYAGAWRRTALAALGVSALLVTGLATRKPWRRPRGHQLVEQRPWFVSFSTWLMTALVVPNVLQGVLVLTREGPRPDYLSSLALGLLFSAIHGAYALADRWRARSRAAAGSGVPPATRGERRREELQ